MKRKFYDTMLRWKNKSQGTTVLMIEGARRVGKSYIAEEFARNEYDSYIMIDFLEENDDFKARFNELRSDLDSLFLFLQAYYSTRLIERRSVIILDEIQKFPPAREMLKYLVNDGRYDYIETGSLISISSSADGITIPSEEEKKEMYPMDFEEFLWAMSDTMLLEAARDAFIKRKPVGDALHRKLMNRFSQYVVTGGMPQAVAKLAETNSYEDVDRIKRSIISLYRDDISKAKPHLVEKIRSVFDLIPSELNRHEKKFRLSDIRSGARNSDYREAFLWLEDAKLVNMCYRATEPNIGLRMNKDDESYKCYFADTGLLLSMAFDENELASEGIMKKLAMNKLEVNKGMLIENVVAQMLAATGRKLYFFSSYSRNSDDRMEVDFLIAKSRITSRHNISPIEVKSSTNYTLCSLSKYRRKYTEYINQPYVIHTSDYMEKDGVIYLPIYMTPLL